MHVAVGDSHMLATSADGCVFSWGKAHTGSLGRSEDQPGFFPGPVDLTEPVQSCAAGRGFSLFLTKQGQVFSCGDGSMGCLGHGDKKSRRQPALVSGGIGGKKVVEIAAGRDFCLALTADGELWAWGSDENGQVSMCSL